MVLAVGMDLVEVSRIARAMRNPRFVERVLTSRERERPLTPAYVAGRWAAKEAAAKCVPGLRKWHDVEVLNHPDGRPFVVAAEGVLAVGERLMVSVTHERAHAAAVVLLVRGPGC